MDQHGNHTDLIGGFYEEQKEIFESSNQAMYAFLDDDSRVCNKKLSTLLGYDSPEEWSKLDVKGSFPDAFVMQDSQQSLVEAYQNAMESGVGSTINISWKKKSGESVDTTVMLVPIMYHGHALALHFIW